MKRLIAIFSVLLIVFISACTTGSGAIPPGASDVPVIEPSVSSALSPVSSAEATPPPAQAPSAPIPGIIPSGGTPAASEMDFSKPGVYPIYGHDLTGSAIGEAITCNVDLNGDGKTEPLTIYPGLGAWVEYGGQKTVFVPDTPADIQYGAIIRRDGGGAALVVELSIIDSQKANIYAVNNGQLQETDELGFAIANLAPDSIDVYSLVTYFLGDQILYGTVGLSADFKIVYPSDGFFNVAKSSDPVLQYFGNPVTSDWFTLKVDLPVQKLVNSQYVDATMSAGTQITPQKMNLDVTKAIVEDSSGATWLLTADRSSDRVWPSYRLASGTLLPEEQVFDGCIYAGP